MRIDPAPEARRGSETSIAPLPFSRAVQDYLVPWSRLDWPVDWQTVFGREAPLRVELGFGNGEYLEREARRSPESDWVGVELSWGSLRRFLHRVAVQGLSNARAVDGNAAIVLERLFAPGSLDQVVINHSDPWPKKRHHERRLVQPELAAILAQCLRPGGRVTIVTDHPEYGDWIASVLAAEPRVHSSHPTPWVHALPDRVPTRYERKALAAGVGVRYFVWERAQGDDPPPRPERVELMPNVVLEGAADLDRLFSGFRSESRHEEHEGTSVLIRLEAAYRRGDGREWVVECRLDEGGYQQHFLLSVLPREGGRLLVKPSPVGAPRPTWGVRRGVHHLARYLLEGAPGLRAVSSSVGSLGGEPPLADPA